MKIIPVALFFLSFFASLVSNAILRQVAKDKNILIDLPDESRKFHTQPTPQTGGIGISIGIIFSAIFLIFLTEPSYDNDISSKNLIGNDQNLLLEENLILDDSFISLDVEFSDELIESLKEKNSLLLRPIDDDRFILIDSSGEAKLYDFSTTNQKNIEKFYDNNKEDFSLNNFNIGLIVFTLIVQVIMIFDDLWSIRPLAKLLYQSLCVLGLIIVSDIYIANLGNLFGFGEISLGIFGIPFTVFCVVGMMNAFNFIDGLNGLCASMSLVCFVTIAYMINLNDAPSLFPLILPIGSIMGFLMYNLGIFGSNRNVFLGDNGANALGFMSSWMLIYFSSHESANFAPVTALWLIAFPLMNAVYVIINRYFSGIFLMTARSDHVHNILSGKGLSSENIYIVLIIGSGIFAFVGSILNSNFFEKDFISFYCFVVFSLCYYLYLNKLEKSV